MFNIWFVESQINILNIFDILLFHLQRVLLQAFNIILQNNPNTTFGYVSMLHINYFIHYHYR